MSKTILEKRIEQRAEERFEKELKEFIGIVERHPIGKLLRISIEGKNIPIAANGPNYGLFNYEGTKNSLGEKTTNLGDVKEKLLEKYKQEETDEILSKLDNLNYLFEQIG